MAGILAAWAAGIPCFQGNCTREDCPGYTLSAIIWISVFSGAAVLYVPARYFCGLGGVVSYDPNASGSILRGRFASAGNKVRSILPTVSRITMRQPTRAEQAAVATKAYGGNVDGSTVPLLLMCAPPVAK